MNKYLFIIKEYFMRFLILTILMHALHEVHMFNSFLYLLVMALEFFNDIFNQNLKFIKVFFLTLVKFLEGLI